MFTINAASFEAASASFIPAPMPAAEPPPAAGACAAIRAYVLAHSDAGQPLMRRCEMQRALEAAGFNPATVRTQIQRALRSL